jgi:nicotinamidase-related amidase
MALLIIDVQKGFDDPCWGRRNHPDMEHRLLDLLSAWRDSGRTVVHAKHMSDDPSSPLRPNQPGNDFKERFSPLPYELVIEKRVNSCFIGTPLEVELIDRDIDGLVIAGLTTNHCVSTTARMASNLGFLTWVVADATATFDRVGPDGTLYPAATIQAVSLCDLHKEFATVVNTEQIVAAATGKGPAARARI